MTLHLYFACFGVALIGMGIQIGFKLLSLQQKARAGNVKFDPIDYFKNDWLSIGISFLTIILVLVCVDNLLNWKPAIIDYIKILFGFVGYTGGDIASRIFGVVNKKINSIIDIKTDKADGVAEKTLTEIPGTGKTNLADLNYPAPPAPPAPDAGIPK